MPRSNIETGLRRGARASLLLCATSSLTTRLLGLSWKTLTSTTGATLLVGFALSRPRCLTVDSIAGAHALSSIRSDLISRVFHLSPTVLPALYQLSSYYQTRYLWIDSICINRRDAYEKGSQITLMRDIRDRLAG
ncbi:hypothetical protein PpBr36_02698 [Pyricularia pennisetigena]|uniref:hypothetical protein n=1 Tax=Pyricularia pennisetigena TaxID=1578925 RepID=UPI00114FA73A|nr:hypothetical protein PpBr36_02698 [Pyricularia pennisetigena]TLS30479.1 hypothetical protein PpBr36_02698 [Pyricularia pennisetigena]